MDRWPITKSFACHEFGETPLVTCMDRFMATHLAVDVMSPCFRCTLGAFNRASFSESRDATSEEVHEVMKGAVDTGVRGFTAKCILKALGVKPMRMKELAAVLKFRETTVRQALIKLQKKQKVITNGGVWRIVH